MKNKRFSRIVSLLLSAVMICTAALAGTGAAFAAGDTYQIDKTNLIDDPELNLSNGFAVKDKDDRWTGWTGWYVSKSDTGGRSGSSGVQFSAKESSIEQMIDGSRLQSGVTYVFSVWVKVESGNALQVGVKEYGGDQKYTSTVMGDWQEYSVEFTYLSGDPIVYIYNNTWTQGAVAAAAYVDDASLTAKGDVEFAHIENGVITVRGVNLDMARFSAVYTSSLNPGSSKILDLTVEDGKLSFTPIAAVPLTQIITVILSYKDDEKITLSFDIAASDGPVVPVQIASLRVANGSATITLKEAPTLAPAVSDFQFEMTVDGVKAPFSISSFAYSNGNTVTVGFDPVSSSLSANREVSLTVTAGETSASDGFTVAKGTSHTYYVSSSGSDTNDGLSPEKPFKTIDKLNSLTFVPGDQILFKTGDTFVGMFKPRGSGAEGAPIVVSSYGGDSRPVIRPDKNAVFTYGLGAGAANPRTVNGTIWLENIDHWEIRGLELHDPDYDPEFYMTGNLEVYNAGIRVVNVDQGDLSHFVFDDLVIHGFRGPSTNQGKTSGGIQFNVNTEDFVPSCFVDVSITNCVIYQCGRSGVNSLTRWGHRNYNDAGDPWPNFPGSDQYSLNCSYYPSRNLYIANCTIHDIDGDGVIVDSWSNAVLENNTVYRCAIHLCDSSRAAVGLFNWNCDNTVFQYNECYSNGVNATRHTNGSTAVAQGVTAQDGQGIEVDALNQNSWVQYNYLHDNAAFMMMCSFLSTYTSYNAVVRYNVTENDGCNPDNDDGMGWFYNGPYAYNTQVYNNTCILGKSALSGSGIDLLKSSYNSNQYKFYNNIFVYTGDEAVGVNNWQDNTDWQNNIFININGLPTQDNANYPNVPLTKEQGEDLFVGGSGPDAYRLTTGQYDGKGVYLPSMNDGMFSGVDFAGNHVDTKAAPGIGAFQYAG